MAILAGVLLALYLMGIVYALLAPSRGHDPQRGQAVGCLMIVAAGVTLLGAALGIGVAFDLEWLVSVIIAVTVYPSLLLVANGVYFGVQRLRNRN
ncbi:MAG: hypothetical protein C0467_08265 [Planctomycetaceae bacterium]|nr:hypothetical protein [Planctomycetaceae bacterium]